MDVTITKDNTDEIIKKVEEAKQRALEKIGLIAEGYAKGACPVDTGRLRNSISHTRDDDNAYIGTNVEYAPYVELGTRRRAAVHFLRNAAADHTKEYKQIIEDELHNA